MNTTQKSSEHDDQSLKNLSKIRIITGSYDRILTGLDVRISYEEKSFPTPLNTVKTVFKFAAHTGSIRSISSNGRYLASGGADEVIRLYDIKRRKTLGSLIQHQGAITCLTFPSKTFLLSADEDGKICIWRTRDWEVMQIMKGHKGRVNDIAVHPSSKIAISVGKDCYLRLWNLMTAHKASGLKLGYEGFCVQWSIKGEFYAIGTDHTIIGYELDGSKRFSHESRVKVHCFKFITVGGIEMIIYGAEDGTLVFIDTILCSAEAGKVEARSSIKGHKSRIKKLAVAGYVDDHTPQMTVIASASSDGIVKLWKLVKDNSLQLILEHDTGTRLTQVLLVDAGIEQLYGHNGNIRAIINEVEQEEFTGFANDD